MIFLNVCEVFDKCLRVSENIFNVQDFVIFETKPRNLEHEKENLATIEDFVVFKFRLRVNNFGYRGLSSFPNFPNSWGILRAWQHSANIVGFSKIYKITCNNR